MAENCATTSLKKLKPLFCNDKRFLVEQGGMRAGKTWPTIMLITSWLQMNADMIWTIASMSYPHLARGAIRDFQNIMKAAGIWEPERWNSSSHIYTFSNGSVLEFVSCDKMGAHGSARNGLFVNEANAMDRDTFEQLASRTTGKIVIDYNPTAEFWVHTWLLKEYADKTDFIILTYKDNEALAPTIREYIESKAPKEGEEPSNWWVVYGLGQIGTLEGNVYSGWEQGEEKDMRNAGRLVRYGLDFGFSNDETAMVAIYDMGEKRIGIAEKIYKKGLLPSQYCSELEKNGIDKNVLIIADGARPEIIAEIKRGGFRCISANKDAGSVLRGIERVSEYQVVYDGKDLEREYLSYAWRKKKSTGELLDEPQDGNDHLLDALRYAVDDLSKPRFDF